MKKFFLCEIVSDKQSEKISSIHKKNYRLYRCLISPVLIFVMLLISVGCSQGTMHNTAQTSSTEINIENQPIEQEQTESGAIRLWWTPRQNLNPVMDQTYSGQAAYKLIYDSLVEFDKNGLYQYNLANSIVWSDNGLQLTVYLDENINFHDGTELSAYDAAASLAWLWSQYGGPVFNYADWTDMGIDDQDTNSSETVETTETSEDNETPVNDDELDEEEDQADPDDQTTVYPQRPDMKELFSSLQSIKIENEYVFSCLLSEAQIEFISVLDYPVIPASSWSADDAFSIIPGTGSYAISEMMENGDLVLKNIDSDGKAADVIIKQFPDVHKAMQALENDQLDLVLLDSDRFADYMNRKNLELIRYTGDSSVFLTINTNSGTFASVEKQLWLKSKINRSAILDTGFWPGELSDIPLSINNDLITSIDRDYLDVLSDLYQEYGLDMELIDHNFSLSSVIETETESDNDDSQLETVDLVVPQSEYLQGTVARIVDILSDNFDVMITYLDESSYEQALENRDYDLVLCESGLPKPEEPAWLYGFDGSVKGIELLDNPGLLDYDSKRIQLSLYHDVWYTPVETGRIDAAEIYGEYAEAMMQTAAASPYIHLYLSFEAVAYGDRVQGQNQPDKNNPYRGIEELWIWSGQ